MIDSRLYRSRKMHFKSTLLQLQMYMELILRDASLHLLRTQTVNVESHISIFDFSYAFTLQLSE
jgi:hypothetical protein